MTSDETINRLLDMMPEWDRMWSRDVKLAWFGTMACFAGLSSSVSAKTPEPTKRVESTYPQSPNKGPYSLDVKNRAHGFLSSMSVEKAHSRLLHELGEENAPPKRLLYKWRDDWNLLQREGEFAGKCEMKHKEPSDATQK